MVRLVVDEGNWTLQANNFLLKTFRKINLWRAIGQTWDFCDSKVSVLLLPVLWLIQCAVRESARSTFAGINCNYGRIMTCLTYGNAISITQ
jgi:hypothetical protein